MNEKFENFKKLVAEGEYFLALQEVEDLEEDDLMGEVFDVTFSWSNEIILQCISEHIISLSEEIKHIFNATDIRCDRGEDTPWNEPGVICLTFLAHSGVVEGKPEQIAVKRNSLATLLADERFNGVYPLSVSC